MSSLLIGGIWEAVEASKVQWAVDKGNIVDSIIYYSGECKEWSPLNCAIEKGRFGEAIKLLDYSDINRKDNNVDPLNRVLSNALKKRQKLLDQDQKMLVTELVRRGANLCTDPISFHSPLCSACSLGDVEIVEMLLDFGSDINEQNGRPLEGAIWSGDQDFSLVTLLVNKGAILFPGKAYFLGAVTRERYDLIDWLLANGMDINERDVIAPAIFRGQWEWVDQERALRLLQFLLEKGADPNIMIDSTQYGSDSPLGCAISLTATTTQQARYRKGVINLLLAYGAKL